jgi:hypothetical protein
MTNDDKKPELFSKEFIQALEDQVKDLIGAPMLRQLKDAVDKNFRKDAPSWADVTDGPDAPVSPEQAAPVKTADTFLGDVWEIVEQIQYKPDYKLLCKRDRKDPEGRVYLQVECSRPDAITGIVDVGRGGKAYLSEHMTEGEVVRKAFGLFMAYEEHECREFFKWDKRAIFGPHIDPHALWEVANKREHREQ